MRPRPLFHSRETFFLTVLSSGASFEYPSRWSIRLRTSAAWVSGQPLSWMCVQTAIQKPSQSWRGNRRGPAARETVGSAHAPL